jgi:hypothetical protein
LLTDLLGEEMYALGFQVHCKYSAQEQHVQIRH